MWKGTNTHTINWKHLRASLQAAVWDGPLRVRESSSTTFIYDTDEEAKNLDSYSATVNNRNSSDNDVDLKYYDDNFALENG